MAAQEGSWYTLATDESLKTAGYRGRIRDETRRWIPRAASLHAVKFGRIDPVPGILAGDSPRLPIDLAGFRRSGSRAVRWESSLRLDVRPVLRGAPYRANPGYCCTSAPGGRGEQSRARGTAIFRTISRPLLTSRLGRRPEVTEVPGSPVPHRMPMRPPAL